MTERMSPSTASGSGRRSATSPRRFAPACPATSSARTTRKARPSRPASSSSRSTLGPMSSPSSGPGRAPAGRVAARAGEGAGRAGRGRSRQRGGDPEEDGARRRALHAPGRARIGQPARAGQRGPEQPRPTWPRWRRPDKANRGERAGGRVEEREADIERLQAALAEAQLNLGWTKIISPITGIAGIKKVDIGDSGRHQHGADHGVAGGSDLRAVPPQRAGIPALEPARGDPGRSRQRPRDFELILADGTTYPHQGTAEILGREVGITTGTITVRGVFPNPGDLLRPGQFGEGARRDRRGGQGALLVAAAGRAGPAGAPPGRAWSAPTTRSTCGRCRSASASAASGSIEQGREAGRAGHRGGTREGQGRESKVGADGRPDRGAERSHSRGPRQLGRSRWPPWPSSSSTVPSSRSSISILMVILGLVAMVQLPIAQYPNIAPPEIQLAATYVGADALTLEQSVATPIEQQMSGVDNMIYMYSTNANTAADDSARQLRRRHRSEHRPGARADALLAGRSRSCRRTCTTTASPSRSPRRARSRCSRCTRRRAPTTRSSSPTTPTSTSTTR